MRRRWLRDAYRLGCALDRLEFSNLDEDMQMTQPSTAEKTIAESCDGGRHSLGALSGRCLELLGTVNDMIVAPVALKAGYSSRDFTPIAKLSINTTALVAHPDLAANSVDELAVLAKQGKAPLLSGAAGAAMMQTIGGTLLANAAGFKIDHVVYKGGAPLLNDLVSGQVQVGTIALTSALPMIRAGKLKALGVISAQRDPTAPQIPTVNEGKTVKGVEADLWTGLMGPANLPAPVVERLASALREVMLDQAYKSGEFKAGSIVAEPNDQKAFAQYLQKEEARLQPVLATIKVNE